LNLITILLNKKSNYSNRGAIGSAISFDPTQVVTNEGTYFQWFTSPTQINQLAGRNPLSILNNKIILELHIEVLEIFKQNIRFSYLN
jgi:hypothetical protein